MYFLKCDFMNVVFEGLFGIKLVIIIIIVVIDFSINFEYNFYVFIWLE